MENILTSETISDDFLEQKMTELIDTYGTHLLRLCTLYLKDKHLAEDAIQEVYIKVWENYDSFQGDSTEKTWITRIAINVCKNYMRKPWYRKTDLCDMAELLGSVESETVHVEHSIDLMNQILKLREKYRTVILLYYYEELSVKEIAEVLDKKESTVLSLLKRGREQLKQFIDE